MSVQTVPSSNGIVININTVTPGNCNQIPSQPVPTNPTSQVNHGFKGITIPQVSNVSDFNPQFGNDHNCQTNSQSHVPSISVQQPTVSHHTGQHGELTRLKQQLAGHGLKQVIEPKHTLQGVSNTPVHESFWHTTNGKIVLGVIAAIVIALVAYLLYRFRKSKTDEKNKDSLVTGTVGMQNKKQESVTTSGNDSHLSKAYERKPYIHDTNNPKADYFSTDGTLDDELHIAEPFAVHEEPTFKGVPPLFLNGNGIDIGTSIPRLTFGRNVISMTPLK